MIEFTCQMCGKTYYNYASRVGRSKYCSDECKYKVKSKGKFVTCLGCGKEFWTRPSMQQKYCSRECFNNSNRMTFICAVCGKEFTRSKSNAKYGNPTWCSLKCMSIGMRKGEDRICEQCGKSFYAPPSDPQKYCGLDCKYEASRFSFDELKWSRTHEGYLRKSRCEHPLSNKSGTLLQHWWVVYEAADDKQAIIDLKKQKAIIHHRNGKRDDNRIENLELRLTGSHPRGVGEDEMVEFLHSIGYKVEK